jgi:8-oxo-dGTP diphosphatase
MKEKKEVLEEVIGHQFTGYYKIPIEKFFQFAVSVDCVILGYHENGLKVLLIQRGAEPHQGKMALPGDLVYPNEDLELAATRVLKELTGLDHVFMTQTRSYGQVDRHPVGRVITVGYYSLISVDRYEPLANSWADNVSWVQPVGFELLPKEFTLGEMQALYENILNEKFDKANFRKRILSMGLLKDTKRMQSDVPHRPARLFTFDKEAYQNLLKKGTNFEF